MKYIVVFLMLFVLYHLLSFAVFNWKNKNKLAAIGAVIIGLTAFVMQFVLMFFMDV